MPGVIIRKSCWSSIYIGISKVKFLFSTLTDLDIRIRAAMRVVQPKTEKYNNKTETAFKYAVFIR